MTPAPAVLDPQRAIEAANAAIRTYLRARHGRALAAGERAEYERLVDVYMAAVSARDEQTREAETEGEPVAA